MAQLSSRGSAWPWWATASMTPRHPGAGRWGLAIGAGTDIAIESADVVLMKFRLLDIPAAMDLSRAVLRDIKQNLFWAFIYNAIGIPLAAGVLYPALHLTLNPMLAPPRSVLRSVQRPAPAGLKPPVFFDHPVPTRSPAGRRRVQSQEGRRIP